MHASVTVVDMGVGTSCCIRRLSASPSRQARWCRPKRETGSKVTGSGSTGLGGLGEGTTLRSHRGRVLTTAIVKPSPSIPSRASHTATPDRCLPMVARHACSIEQGIHSRRGRAHPWWVRRSATSPVRRRSPAHSLPEGRRYRRVPFPRRASWPRTWHFPHGVVTGQGRPPYS